MMTSILGTAKDKYPWKQSEPQQQPCGNLSFLTRKSMKESKMGHSEQETACRDPESGMGGKRGTCESEQTTKVKWPKFTTCSKDGPGNIYPRNCVN